MIALRRKFLLNQFRTGRNSGTISLFDDGALATRRFSSDRRGGQRHPQQKRRSPQSQRTEDRSSSTRHAVYADVHQVLEKSRRDAKAAMEGTKSAPTMSPGDRILSAAKGGASSWEDEHSRDKESDNSTGFHPLTISKDGPIVYSDLIDKIVSGRRFRRKHTSKPIPVELADPVVEYLRREEALCDCSELVSTIKKALQRDYRSSGSDDLKNQLQSEIKKQRDRFFAATGWKEEQYKMLKAALQQAASICAKNGLGEPVELIWLKMKETGVVEKNAMHTVLHVAATFLPGNRRKRALYGKYSGGSILQILEGASIEGGCGAEEDLTDIVDEIATYHDLRYEPTEQSLMVRSRLLIAQGNAREAEELLTIHSELTDLHLRSFLPVLRMYLESGEIESALRVYKKMRELSPVRLDAETYVNLIASIAEHGGFHPSTPPIDNLSSLGFQAASGPQLLDVLVAEMKEEIIEIPSSLARRLHNAFAEGFPDSGVEKLTSLAPLKMNEDPMRPDEQLLADLVPIDPFTGECRRTGITLRLEHLSDPQILELKNGVLELAADRQNQFLEKMSKHKSTSRRGEAVDLLRSFFRWLDRRIGEPFTVIIDGPNVAYFMQNFETGRFSYHQIKFVIDELERVGERPLVILPRKYTFDFFTVSVGAQSEVGAWKQRLTSAEKRIRTELMDSGKLAIVPSGFLDDYYWILASVSKQTNSRAGRDLTVPPDDPSGRWPGTRPVLITNDQMRDHKLAMLEPMLFRRWYSNYIVNYNFPAFVGSECSRPEIGFSPADFFSREIQCNKMSNGNTVWHFPVSDMQDVWFCLSVSGEEQQEQC
eukprot:scaffold15910_cov193-Amphora_coffeaeformis.AAC.7